MHEWRMDGTRLARFVSAKAPAIADGYHVSVLISLNVEIHRPVIL